MEPTAIVTPPCHPAGFRTASTIVVSGAWPRSVAPTPQISGGGPADVTPGVTSADPGRAMP